MNLVTKRDTLIKKWLEESSKEIKESLEGDLKVQTKSRRNDLVTQMDKEIEKN